MLRGVERKKNMINFHTDSRSKKVSQLEEQADICALFYDKKKKVQLRVYGKTSYEKDIQKIENKWQNSKRMSKLCYLNKYPLGRIYLTLKIIYMMILRLRILIKD